MAMLQSYSLICSAEARLIHYVQELPAPLDHILANGQMTHVEVGISVGRQM